jgi:hypothetical protein
MFVQKDGLQPNCIAVPKWPKRFDTIIDDCGTKPCTIILNGTDPRNWPWEFNNDCSGDTSKCADRTIHIGDGQDVTILGDGKQTVDIVAHVSSGDSKDCVNTGGGNLRIENLGGTSNVSSLTLGVQPLCPHPIRETPVASFAAEGVALTKEVLQTVLANSFHATLSDRVTLAGCGESTLSTALIADPQLHDSNLTVAGKKCGKNAGFSCGLQVGLGLHQIGVDDQHRICHVGKMDIAKGNVLLITGVGNDSYSVDMDTGPHQHHGAILDRAPQLPMLTLVNVIVANRDGRSPQFQIQGNCSLGDGQEPWSGHDHWIGCTESLIGSCSSSDCLEKTIKACNSCPPCSEGHKNDPSVLGCYVSHP